MWRRALELARLVFIQTSINTAILRLRGRCPRGIRLIDHVPHAHTFGNAHGQEEPGHEVW